MRQAPLLLRSIVPECTLRTSLALPTQLEESTWLPRTVDRIDELLRNLEILLRCCIAALLPLPLPSPLCHRGAGRLRHTQVPSHAGGHPSLAVLVCWYVYEGEGVI